MRGVNVMKVIFNRAALAQALALLTSVVPTRTPKPILKCVKITAENDLLTLSATNLESGIQYSLQQAQIDQPGQIVIPADRINAIVRESLDETLTLTADQAECKITGLDSEFTIYSHDADQYPAVPGFEGDPHLEITLENLQSGIERCLFATAKESTRYALNGVLWEIQNKKLSMVATDGRRLAKVQVNLNKAADDSVQKNKIIVPAKTMSLLDKIGSTDSDTVNIQLIDNQIVLQCQNVTVSSNLVEGNFPKYEDIIPTDYKKKLTLQTEAVLSAVKRASLLTSEESRGIKCRLDENLLTFSARAPETGDATIEMKIEYPDEPIEIGFNPQFLVDVLRVINTQQFELHLGTADRPRLIKAQSDFLYVLMPINLG